MNKILQRVGDYLLDKALASECRAAGLVRASVRLSFGEVDYLKRNGSAGRTGADAVVMLHGAVADKSSWVRFARHLRSPSPLLIPDLPGHGESACGLELDYGIQAQVLRVEEWLAALGIRRVHLVGSSMGGAIAMRLAAGSPDLVSSLVLVGTAGVEARPGWLRTQVEQTGTNPMLEIRDVSGYRAMMRIGMQAPPYIPGIIMSALTRRFIRHQAVHHKVAADIGRDLDSTACLERISTPCLIVWGAADKVMHVDNAEFLHRRLARSRKLILDKVGHVPMVEAPRQLAAACDAFFGEVAPT